MPRGTGWIYAALCVSATLVAPPAIDTVQAGQPPHAQSDDQDKNRDRNDKARRGGRADWDRRFHGLDRNDDGAISRREWDGDDRAFAVHDWNRDGVLSGDEVRAGAAPPPVTRGRDEPDHVLFKRMDANADGRVTRNEFTGSRRTFERLDANDDGALSPYEYGVGR